MLQSIHIQNYALIETLDIDFHPGFSVITGETGAGKSIILGAIGLLVGQRADIKAIRNGANKCVVEARFDISSYQLESFFEENDLEYESGECILRRELLASGKSRAFINDTPASLVQMKALGEKLIDVHSQHQNLLLNHEDFQLSVLDILAHDEAELTAYKTTYKEYKQVSRELAELIAQAEKNRQEEDYIRFQVQQLDDARLQAGEQEELEQEAETLSHAEEIKAGIYKVDQVMASDGMSLLSATKDCIHTIQGIAKVYAPAQEWTNRLESCYIELKDLSSEIADVGEEIEFNPSRLDFVNERLNLIYSLQQKHHVSTLDELLTLAEKLRMQLDDITSSDDRINELTRKKEELYNKVMASAHVLTDARTLASKQIEEQMQAYLVPLGMPNVRFAVDLTLRKEPDKLPTIIFDEIDTGVSGSIAEKMAFIMQEMGQADRQVISITHLPQIAARGANHYKVYKEDTETGTNSHIRPLDHEERINEIAHMLSGATLTEAALNNAKALLNNENL